VPWSEPRGVRGDARCLPAGWCLGGRLAGGWCALLLAGVGLASRRGPGSGVERKVAADARSGVHESCSARLE
jgi:hypothetical protein